VCFLIVARAQRSRPDFFKEICHRLLKISISTFPGQGLGALGSELTQWLEHAFDARTSRTKFIRKSAEKMKYLSDVFRLF
jgi:hypothetical protein